MEVGQELRAVVRLDDVDAKGQSQKHFIDELDCGAFVGVFILEPQLDRGVDLAHAVDRGRPSEERGGEPSVPRQCTGYRFLAVTKRHAIPRRSRKVSR
jgi:hypothetical protein